MNKYTIKAFNELWFRKFSISKKTEITTLSNFFYPLDKINNWNLIYGSKGFYQYQFVIPEKSSFFISESLKILRENYVNSFLTVLKRFGKQNNGFLSFPEHGWTLTFDLPGSNKNTLNVLKKLDKKISVLGGKIYLAKDLSQQSEIFKKTYPNYHQWKLIKEIMDPNNIFQSDLSRRLEIIRN